MSKRSFLYLFYLVSCQIIYAQDTLFIPSGTIAEPSVFSVDTTRSYTEEQVNDSTFIRYYAPKWHDFVSNIPGDVKLAGKTLFSKESIKPLSIITGATALLYVLDRQLVDGTQKLSRKIKMDPQSRFESFIKVGDIDIMQVPGNLNTGFYFFGEGWTSILLFSGIGIHGAFTKNNKEILMLSQFIEGYIEMGITTQLLKRSFGRQTPKAATTHRGKFRFFPSFSRYQKNVSHYDAMPSGHMATMAFTVTLLAEHYPDNQWIRPVGYALMGICGLSMLNNGVHWASDYPLGFGIGYLFAKVVAQRGKIVHHTGRNQTVLNRLEFFPTLFETGESGIKLVLKL